jgi:hypothetical protein
MLGPVLTKNCGQKDFSAPIFLSDFNAARPFRHIAATLPPNIAETDSDATFWRKKVVV